MQFKINSIKKILVGLSLLLAGTTVSAQQKTEETVELTKCHKTVSIEKKMGITIPNDSSLFALYNEAVTWLKTPYRRGGTSSRGMDCSGLTSTIYNNVFGIKLQRSSRDMSAKDVQDLHKDDLQPGDLVFFGTSSRKGRRVNHVGIFLGDRRFIHSSCSRGVIVSSLDESYYRRTWIKGGRVKMQDKIVVNKIPTT